MLLNGLTTESFAIIAESMCTLILGIVVSFFYSWRMALIVICMIPLVAMGAMLSAKLTARAKGMVGSGNGKTDSTEIDYYKESNALLSDAIMNYRTVISFGPKNINHLIEKYNSLLRVPKMQGVRNAHTGGIGFGYAFFIRFIFMGVAFYLASLIIWKYDLEQEDNYMSVMILFMSAIGAGMNLSNMPSVSKARKAAN